MSSDPIRTEPWAAYMQRQERRWREADMLAENERLREECHRLTFELEHERAIRWSLQERLCGLMADVEGVVEEAE